MRIITRNKKFFFTGEFKGSSSPERVQLGYSLEMIQLDPPEAEEHWSLKNFFLMRIITRNKKFFFTGEFKGSSPGYSLEMIQLDPPEAEEHLSLEKNFFSNGN